MATAVDVLEGRAKWSVECGDCLEWLSQLPADSVDCAITSPPYMDARSYGIGAQRDCAEWVAWMLDVVAALHRVCKGPTFVVVGGVTRERSYWPGCEGLAWEWWKRGGDCQMYRPCVFHRVGIPGSGGDDYLRADWEYVLCFKRPGKLPWSDNTACGHTPKYGPGGEMSHRTKGGSRVNAFGMTYQTSSDGDGVTIARPLKNAFGTATDRPVGSRSTGLKNAKKETYRAGSKKMYSRHGDERPEDETYQPPVLANPGNLIHCKVGGGNMGDPLASDNEAPFPEKLVEFFMLSFCPPNGVACDVFSGSGTTAAVAVKNGRRFVGCDVRASQCELTERRLANVTPTMFS